jgi:hypothetical protein
MTMVWDKMIPLSEKIISKMDNYEKVDLDNDYQYNGSDFSWRNYKFVDKSFRQAHIEIVDAREFKKIWVLHMTIFPNTTCPSPIFGFDVVAGANKITGAFHDFSKMGDSWLYIYFLAKHLNKNWNNPRVLPEWAEQIFSPGMLAVSNINTEEELDRLCGIAIDNLDYYLYNIVYENYENNQGDYAEKQNRYCKFQKQNPHTPAMMASLGINKDLFAKYMDDVLFPEIK